MAQLRVSVVDEQPEPTILYDLVAPYFPDLTVTRHEGFARLDSIDAWLHTDIRGWTLTGMIDDPTFDTLLTEARDALAAFTDGNGRVAFPAPALIATATKQGSPQLAQR